MKNVTKNILACLWLCFAALSLQAAELRDFAGQPRTIDDYAGHGKWLVVMFWASDCHVCNAEARQYNRFHDAHRERDASVLGLAMDGQAGLEEAKAFVLRHELGFPNLIGEPEAIAALFTSLTGMNWIGTPSFLIYDPGGELVVQQVGAVPVKLIEEFIASNSPGAE